MSIRAIDLFCGAGGSSWGARNAGVEIAAGFDMWPLAGAAFADNFPEARFFEGRLDQFTRLRQLAGDLGRIDLILASPECTNHSVAKGNAPRCEASRDTAFEVVRFAKALAPRWLVIENVTSMRLWCRFTEFLDRLKALGYHLSMETLDASWFGVPQRRRRLFILADRERAPSPVRKARSVAKPAKSILESQDRYEFSLLHSSKRASATLERAERAMKRLGSQADFLLVYYGSDAAGGWQSLESPLRTITTLDRFAYVRPGRRGHERACRKFCVRAVGNVSCLRVSAGGLRRGWRSG